MKLFKLAGIHLILIFGVLFILISLAALVLRSTTRHGEALTVPDIIGLKTEDAISILAERKLRFLITDSMFFEDKPKLSIIDQNPAAESKVKEGRIIYLIVNSDKPPGVSVPNLIDASLRQAQAMLKAAGLKQGNISYKPDMAQNVVLEQLFLGNTILPNSKIPKGSAIDLVLGSGLIDSIDVAIPDLSGLTRNEAHNLLSSASLNLGAVVYQGDIADTSQAKVTKQVPPAGQNSKGGQSVDIYLKQE